MLPNMAPVVEARSLAFLTTLASDPPLYPYNPTHASHGPLTLYIVRVPGSRDVFLTPMKPRDKVVNAQDVQSSLYYLHVDDPEDSMLVTAEDQSSYTEPFPTKQYGIEGPHVSRKPLPTPPLSPIDDSEGLFQVTQPRFSAEVPRRKPVSTNVFNDGGTLDLPQIPPRLPQRPGRSPDDMYGYNSLDARKQLPQRPAHGQSSNHQNAYRNFTDFRRENRLTPDSESAQDDGPAVVSLTLIRRDPGSGAQWNVAKITDPPAHEVSSASLGDAGAYRAKRAGAPLFVDISNPGYSKFIHFDRARPTSSHSTDTTSTMLDGQSDCVFRRRVWMDGSRFADHSYTHRKQPSTSSSHRNSRSSLHIGPKGYSFRSPWGGKCEFATGVAGRSLKCKHHADGGASAEVSELRFNLPSATGSVTNTGAGADHSSKRSSRILRPHFHKHTSSDSSFLDSEAAEELPNYFDEEGNIDLSLGQEHAGGGFHGKRAKLGKLIIEDMGLRMLDLTVATNLALWWRAYERV